MASPPTHEITEDFIKVLCLINGTDSYKTSLASPVARTIKLWNEVGKDAMPFLCCAPISWTSIDHQPNRRIKGVLSFKILGHISAETDENRLDQITDMQDDVIRAAYIDVTRGGNAIYTRLTSIFYDLADPLTREVPGFTGLIEMNFDVGIKRSTDGS